jgi:hypothetical protein
MTLKHSSYSAEKTPEPTTPDSPEPPRQPDPPLEPWHDPGPPVRKVNLPPDSPTKAVPVENPERREPPERES